MLGAGDDLLLAGELKRLLTGEIKESPRALFLSKWNALSTWTNF